MTPKEEKEVLKVLNRVGKSLTAIPKGKETWADHYFGNFTWKLSNGWEITVFNDCDEWDYIDCVLTDDGREWHYPFETDKPMTEKVAEWQPQTQKQKDAWGV